MCNPKITTDLYNTQLALSTDETRENYIPKRQLAPTFKPYNMHQSFAIFVVQELISENHIALVVDEMAEAIPNAQLFAYYTGGDRSPYHPKMMLKVILYAYSQKLYSCCGKVRWSSTT
ncbi:transposase [Bacillus niameyensis]|uniref:transposase n=1 Tax=Bacillus niameyensis TaxID=1522308 RepID=UPI00078470A9|nr:transposase [Bacillus niameyensis]